MKIDSGAKLIAAILGIIVGFLLPDIWNWLTSFFG